MSEAKTLDETLSCCESAVKGTGHAAVCGAYRECRYAGCCDQTEIGDYCEKHAGETRAEPTPRPWEFHKSPKVGHNIRDADGNVPGIARTYRDNGDAAHIVKCVNSYDAMREALEELVAEHDNTDDLPRSPDGHICGHKPDTFGIQLARQALEATDRGTG